MHEAATRLGYQSHFFARNNTISDDHLPFMKRGVPCADLIDFNYGYNNVFHHTPQDTVDKLSPKSLEIIGGGNARDRAHSRQDGTAAAEVNSYAQLQHVLRFSEFHF